MKRTIQLAACLCWCFGGLLAVADPMPPFAREAQGDWYVLAAHRNNQNIATGSRVSSRVSITADTITWHDPEKAEMPLVRANCARAAAPVDAKKQADPNELASTVRGSLCPVQDAKVAARWRITSDGALIALVEVAEFKGNRNGTYSGASPADVVLVCQRKPVPAALRPDPEKDARRLVGTWVVLAELDDANTARTRPQGNVKFTAQEFYKLGSYATDAKPQQEATWKVVAPEGERGRIDLIFKSGIELNQGRSPSLYTFYGEDLLMVVYSEGGWAKDAVENQELRKPPTHFGSDGSRNMLILQRKPAGGK